MEGRKGSAAAMSGLGQVGRRRGLFAGGGRLLAYRGGAHHVPGGALEAALVLLDAPEGLVHQADGHGRNLPS